MFAVNQDKADKSIGHILQGSLGTFLALLEVIGERLRICQVFRWVQDERRRNAAIRELNRLTDHYLKDINIKRSEIDSVVDEMMKRLREGRCDVR